MRKQSRALGGWQKFTGGGDGCHLESGAGGDSIVTMEPDVVRDKGVHDRGLAG